MKRLLMMAAIAIACGFHFASEGIPDAAHDDIAQLIVSLGDDDPAVRDRATDRLIEIGTSAHAALEAASGSDDAEVAARASYAMRVIDLKISIPFSKALLTSYPYIYNDLARDPTTLGRNAVFVKLTTIDPVKYELVIDSTISDIEIIIMSVAEEGFEGLSAQDKIRIVNVCCGDYPVGGSLNRNNYSGMIYGSAKYLRSFLKDPAPDLRIATLLAIGALYANECSGDISYLLKDPDAKVRAMAALTLATLESEEYVNEIFPMLEDRSQDVRMQAISALGALQAVECSGALAPFLKDPHPTARKLTAEALGAMNASRFEKDIVALLEDPDELVRQAAASSLGHRKDACEGICEGTPSVSQE